TLVSASGAPAAAATGPRRSSRGAALPGCAPRTTGRRHRRSRQDLRPRPAAAAEVAGLFAQPPELLPRPPDVGERRLADVAGVEAGPEETARVDVALHRDGADVVAGPTGVAGVDLRARRGAGLGAERVEAVQVGPGAVHAGQVAQGVGVLGEARHQVEVVE